MHDELSYRCPIHYFLSMWDRLYIFSCIKLLEMKNSFLSYCNFNSPLRFLLVLNRFRRTAYSSLTSKLWTLTSLLDDADFADDICTLSFFPGLSKLGYYVFLCENGFF